MTETGKKIDSHHHFWRYDAIEYDWIDDKMGAIRRDFLPRDLEHQIAEVGIGGVISVQARQTLEETRWLLSLASEAEFVRGVVGWVPLVEADVKATLEEVSQDKKLRGVRHVLEGEPDPNYMLREDFNRGVRMLEPLGLVYDILILERQLPETIQFVDRHPRQIFVLDHLAKPRVRDGDLSPWRENLKELAQRQNVYCKLSGLVTEAHYHSWTADQLEPYIDVVLNAFGPKRIMFGSDWPVCLVAVPYAQWIAIVNASVAELSEAERECIWSGTAIEAYSLR